MAIVNLGIVLTLDVLERVLGIIDSPSAASTALFFVFLMTVIIVLFDRYRTIYMARRVLEGVGSEVAPRESRPA